jgi:hypothetical protein
MMLNIQNQMIFDGQLKLNNGIKNKQSEQRLFKKKIIKLNILCRKKKRIKSGKKSQKKKAKKINPQVLFKKQLIQ